MKHWFPDKTYILYLGWLALAADGVTRLKTFENVGYESQWPKFQEFCSFIFKNVLVILLFVRRPYCEHSEYTFPRPSVYTDVSFDPGKKEQIRENRPHFLIFILCLA